MQNNSIFSVSVGDLDFLEKCFIPLTTDKKLYCDLGRSSDIRPCDLSRERQTFLKLHVDAYLLSLAYNRGVFNPKLLN